MFSQEEKRTIEVAYTKNEMLEKLQHLRKDPTTVDQNMIYILAKEVNEFHALGRDPQVKIVTTHGVRSLIKTLLFKETPIEKSLRRMKLTPAQYHEYSKALKNGGILLVSGSDPYDERQWTGHTLNKWITNQANSSNLIVWDVKDVRIVPYKPDEEVNYMPEMAVAGEFGQADLVVEPGEMPLKDNQRYVRDPKTKALSIYQAPH